MFILSPTITLSFKTKLGQVDHIKICKNKKLKKNEDPLVILCIFKINIKKLFPQPISTKTKTIAAFKIIATTKINLHVTVEVSGNY